MKIKTVIWAPICQEILRFNLHNQTYFILPYYNPHKIWFEIYFHDLVSRLLLLFININQLISMEKLKRKIYKYDCFNIYLGS